MTATTKVDNRNVHSFVGDGVGLNSTFSDSHRSRPFSLYSVGPSSSHAGGSSINRNSITTSSYNTTFTTHPSSPTSSPRHRSEDTRDPDQIGGNGMRDLTANRSIPERVAQFYYTLGLFCSSHPVWVIIMAISIVLFSCIPLLSLPLPGNKPQEFYTAFENFTTPPLAGWEGSDWPRWYKGPPVTFIQQVIVKSTVLPWSSDLILTDAFRGPLAQVFHLVDSVRNARNDNKSASLSDVCFKVADVKSKALKGKISMLPEYNCLLVSPANFWLQNYAKFQEDADILATITNYQSHQKGRSGVAEILLGMNVRETGLRRYPLKARQRIVTYAVTIVLQTYDHEFVANLKSTLTKMYPTKPLTPFTTTTAKEKQFANASQVSPHDEIAEDADDDDQKIFHIFYPSQSSLLEMVPLVITYGAMYVYVYFSVKKVEMVSSKSGMAFTALATVVASLCMSVGLCSHFGMTFEINAKAIYPYLVVIIGLENILVLTRSVVSTATHLDVKIRVAQGLSKEGWSITKNLLTEITILTIGFFTFVPLIQEFCILAIVGLLSDFFLQTFFFATVLSVDIHRTKMPSDPSHHFGSYSNAPFRTPLHQTVTSPMVPSSYGKMQRIKSNPRISTDTFPVNGVLKKCGQMGSVSVVAPSQSTPILVKIPKRLRLVYFWARTRFFQRTFTIFMVGWISVIIYESGIVAHFNYETEDVVVPINHLNSSNNRLINSTHHQNMARVSLAMTQTPGNFVGESSFVMQTLTERRSKNKITTGSANGIVDDKEAIASSISSFHKTKMLKELYLQNPYIWRRLSLYHWQVLLGVYNVSLSGKYISVLPPICISIPVEPQVAISLRHPLEQKQARKFNWQALANAFDPLDFVDEYDSNVPTVSPLGKIGKRGLMTSSSDDPYIPSSPVELALTMLLAIPSVIFIAYTMVVFYKCICSRNYADWRSSWGKGNVDNAQDSYTQVVFEAQPLILDGHTQEVECMGSDGNVIASVCLSGILKVWNSNAENIVTVDRKRFFEQLSTIGNDESHNFIISDGDSNGCSPPSHQPPYEFMDRSQSSVNNNKESQRRRSQLLQHQHQFLSNQSSFDLQQHSRKSSMCSQFSPPIIQSNSSVALNNYEFSFTRTHRRTASSPTNQFNQLNLSNLNANYGQRSNTGSNCDSPLAHSPPIPIPCSSGSSPINSSMHNHNYGGGSLNANMGNSITPTTNIQSPPTNIFQNPNESVENLNRVGSPLDKISEDCFAAHRNSSRNINGILNPEDVPPIWCLDCQENIIVLGTGSGRLELWDAFTGYLKCVYEDSNSAGVMCVKIIGNRIVAARLNGSLDFIEIESFYSNGQPCESPPPYSRWHSADGMIEYSKPSTSALDVEIRCVWMTTLKAHQQPITCLDCEGGRILTGSQDHTLKVFRLEDQLPIYTLHGHYGPIMCLFIDKISPMTSGSGSHDGMLCVWDLLTGMCMYSIQAHDGPVSALTYSASYIISVGGDDKICVWERFQGHLLNTIQLDHTYCSSLVMLTHNLLITSKQGSLIVWDVRSGEPVRAVRLGHRDNAVFVRQIMGCSDAVLCDYGCQLRLVRFPTVVNKVD